MKRNTYLYGTGAMALVASVTSAFANMDELKQFRNENLPV